MLLVLVLLGGLGFLPHGRVNGIPYLAVHYYINASINSMFFSPRIIQRCTSKGFSLENAS
jgi:hypothetical protein